MEYIATAHPPTSVSHSLLSNLTSPDHQSLVILTTSSIELHNLLPSGSVPACDRFHLWGSRILGSAIVRRPSSSSFSTSSDELLLVVISAPTPLVLFLSYDETEPGEGGGGRLVVEETVEISGPIGGGREGEFFQGVVVNEHDGRDVIVISIWVGVVTVLDLRSVGEEEGKKEKKGGKRGKTSVGAGEGVEGESLIKAKYDLQVKELNLLSLAFLPSSPILSPPPPQPTLCFLHLTPNRTVHLQSRTLNLTTKDFTPSASEEILSVHINDPGSSMLVPLRPVDGTGSSGMVVMGETEVVVYEVGMAGRKIGSPKVVKSSPRIDKGKRRESIEGGDATMEGMPGSVDKGKRRRKSSAAGADGATGLSGSRGVTGKMPFATTTAYAVLDSNDKHTRILLGDSYGQLSLVTLQRSSGRVKTLDFLVLGEIPPPTTLTYLSSSHLFIGSHFGDSLILSLLPSPAPYSGSYLAPPLLAFNNLAPIVDFHKAEGEGGKLVTCSGGMNKGSLRVVRSGVGLEEEGILEGIEGVEGVWSLGEGQDGFHSLLAVSTSTSTIILSLPASPSEDISLLHPSSLPGFDCSLPTLAAGDVKDSGGRRSLAVQVVKSGVTLIDLASGGQQISTWKASSEIGSAAVEEGILLVGMRGGKLQSLTVQEGKLVESGSTTAPSEIATLTITPSTLPFSSPFAAIACWDNSLSIMSALDLSSYSSLSPTPTLARSLLFAALPGAKPQLFVGLGDGSLVCQTLTDEGLWHQGLGLERRTIGLGSTAVGLAKVGETVFASCDTPAVLHAEHGRMSYWSVNIKDVTACTTLNTPAFQNTFIYASSPNLIIGRINEMKKVHVQTIDFGLDNPYRIAHRPDVRAYGVAFVKTVLQRSKAEEIMTSSFKVLDQDTFEPVFTHDLDSTERATSLETIFTPSTSFFALGTAYIEEGKNEVEKGRVLLFGEDSGGGKTRLIGEIPLAGCVYAISGLGEEGLVASVNSRVVYYDVSTPSKPAKKSEWASAYLPTSLVPLPDRKLLVGDAMSSLSVLELKDGQLSTQAKDSKPLWLTSVDHLKGDTYIAADTNCNLLTMKSDGSRLEPQGAFHTGEIINRFRKGSLIPTSASGPGSATKPNLILGSSSGRLSTIVDLDAETSRVLFDLQRNMARVVTGPGGVAWSSWRDFRGDNGSTRSVGFIDGDLVERFLDIKDEEELKEIMAGSNQYEKLSLSYGDLCAVVEGLKRLH